MEYNHIGDTHSLKYRGVTFHGNTKEELLPRAERFFGELDRRAAAYPLALAYAKQGKAKEAAHVIG